MYQVEFEPIPATVDTEQAVKQAAPDPRVLTLQNPDASMADQENALADIYEEYTGPLQGYLLKMLKSPETTEEVAQDTITRAWRYIDTFDPNTSFPAWIYKIAKNAALNRIRDEKRRSGRSVLYGEIPVSVMARSSSSTEDPEKRLIFKAEMGVMASLPGPAQEALAWDPAKTYEQTAEENGITVPAVKSRLVRAREAAKEARAELELTEAEKKAIKEEKARLKQERRRATKARRAREAQFCDSEELAIVV